MVVNKVRGHFDDFGVNWNRALDKGGFVLGNQVTIEILLEMKSK